MWVIGGLFAIACLVAVVREPRRFRCGVFLLGAILAVGLALAGLALDSLAPTPAGPYVVLAFLLLAVVVVVVLGVVLVLNGFTMIRQEGRRLANLLGLFLGLLLLAYVVVSLWSLVTNNAALSIWVLVAGIPAFYLGFAFTAYLLYSGCYLAVTKRWARPAAVVVVLGSGLIDGQVTPLLASRLDTARQVAGRYAGTARLVVSGGKGTDETRSEAAAMTEYLVEKGVDPARIMAEDLSRTTKENIANTQVLLQRSGLTGRVAVVTNNFHAFRAALLMRRAGIAGYAIGAPTARYYWPAATIREFVAILRDSLVFNVICLAVSVLPLLGRVISTLG